jgi:hypothetical protein
LPYAKILEVLLAKRTPRPFNKIEKQMAPVEQLRKGDLLPRSENALKAGGDLIDWQKGGVLFRQGLVIQVKFEGVCH